MRWTGALLYLTTAVGASADPKPVRQVAIIGAGAAGSSAAYHLRQFADQDGVAVNITIFEKTDRIGGRTLTVNVFDNPSDPVELGASIFIEANKILWDAKAKFNLSAQEPDPNVPGILGIWDGDKLVYSQDDRSGSWFNLVKLVIKYGLVPYRVNSLVQATVAKFLKLYDAPFFPFRSLTTRVYELDLVKATGVTGEQFLQENKLYGPFAHDIVQASTRVNYASNLGNIHGLDTMVSLAPQGSTQLKGGNWQIFDHFVRESQGAFYANTSVTELAVVSGSKAPGKRYSLKTKSTTGHKKEKEASSLEFDNVVIAAPFQFSQIKTPGGFLERAIAKVPYVALHVTLFASPLPLSPAFFHLEQGSKSVPTTVLTTLAEGDNATSGSQGAGKAGFFSISTLRTAVNPKTNQTEFVYKIFSPDKVTPAFLSKLFGTNTTESSAVSWYYPYGFHSYPQALPRVSFQDPILDDGLYYTSGIESFISTMETAALMGKNVARLIVDDIKGLKTGGAANTTSTTTTTAANSENAVNTEL